MGKRINETKFNEIYAEWEASGLSVRDYCFSAGITERVFHYWNFKRKNKEKREQGTFMPVSITRTSKGGVAISSRQLALAPEMVGQSSSNSCEIVYPNGVTLRLKPDMSLDTLRILISLYQ